MQVPKLCPDSNCNSIGQGQNLGLCIFITHSGESDSTGSLQSISQNPRGEDILPLGLGRVGKEPSSVGSGHGLGRVLFW
jgi:hypothetical protein